jgi:uncharacterized protein DUF1835
MSIPRTFHVLHTYSAAGIFVQALPSQAEHLLVNDDSLSCGPLPPFEAAQQWTQLRSAFWDRVALGGEPPANFNSDFLGTLLSLNDADSVVFWVGLCASEQLMLACGAHLRRVAGSKAKIHVVQFTPRNGNDWAAVALGLLNPERLAQHPPIEPLSAEALVELERYWTAVTSPDPTRLLAVISAGPTCLPHLRASLHTLLQRYPDPHSGLGRWDYGLLRYTQLKGPKAPRIIGFTMTDSFDADLIGDGYLFWRLRRMAAAEVAHPLVTLSGDAYNMRDCEVTLTDAGHAVLAGRANAIELNGIDDWILGVHLDSRNGPVWCRKEGTLVPLTL